MMKACCFVVIHIALVILAMFILYAFTKAELLPIQLNSFIITFSPGELIMLATRRRSNQAAILPTILLPGKCKWRERINRRLSYWVVCSLLSSLPFARQDLFVGQTDRQTDRQILACQRSTLCVCGPPRRSFVSVSVYICGKKEKKKNSKGAACRHKLLAPICVCQLMSVSSCLSRSETIELQLMRPSLS